MTQTSSSMIKPALTPGKANSLRSVFADTVTRCRNPFILYWIAMVIFGPLAALIDYVTQYNATMLRYSWDGSELIALCYLIFIGASVVIPMVVFSYLDNRRALDVFHALPVTRGKLFWGNTLAILFLLFAPFVVCVLPVAAAVDLSPLWLDTYDPSVVFSMLRVSVMVVGAALMMCGLMVLLMISCSTIVESFGYFCILMVGYLVVVNMGFQAVGSLTFGYVNFWLEDFLNRFSPLSYLFSATSAHYLVYSVQMALLGAALILLGWRRYQNRKSEQAGGYIWAPVYYIAAAFGSLAAGFYIRAIVSSGDDGLDVVSGAVAAVLVFIVLDTIRHRGFKQIVRSAVTSAAGVAGFAVLAVVINLTGTFGYESWVPDVDDVLSVKVDSVELAGLSSAFPLSDSESIETVIRFHETVLGNQEPLEDGAPETLVQYEPFSFADGETLDYSYGTAWVQITYQLKNGREIVRDYNVPAGMAKPLYNLSGSVRYSCAIADRLDAYAQSLAAGEDMTATYTIAESADSPGRYPYDGWTLSLELGYSGPLQEIGSENVKLTLDRQQAIDFFTALAEDFRCRPDRSERDPSDRPAASFNLAQLGIYIPRWSGFPSYIYESDRNTIAFLESLGYYTEADGLIKIGSGEASSVSLAVIPAETAQSVSSLSFYFSGQYLDYYDWVNTGSETAEDGLTDSFTIYIMRNDVEEEWVELENGRGELANLDECCIAVNGRTLDLTGEQAALLDALIRVEGYSEEPPALLFVNGQTYFIPEENLQAVMEIVYGA